MLVSDASTRDVSTGAVVALTATATVQATVLDRETQVAVGGESWPVTLSFLVGSDGDFHGPLRDTLDVVDGQLVDVRVVIDAGLDQRRTLVLPCRVIIDRG